MKWREKSSARIEKPSACPAITVQRENSRRIRRRKAYGFDSSRKNADSALIAKRDYGYDARDRVVSRVQTRGNGESATTRTDAFGCNSRSELTSATLGNAAYAYAFDYIGNRATASEAGTQLAYAANALNQYATITETEAFTPTYDADGNATSVKTATGTWSVSCNGENRPIRFENAGTQTVVECGYDSLGRRFEKKVSVAGTLVLHERYAYRGYLQIAAFDVAGTQEPALKRVIYWDPTEETATRPLAISIVGDNVYFPTVDLTKNVCELVDFYGNVAETYDYAPFGNVSAGTPSGSAVPANPLQWSSEIYDSELDLVYYNYRHYSPSLGRFLSRDSIEEQGGLNLYAFVGNQCLFLSDQLGLEVCWATRDLESFFLGNHHFLMFIFDNEKSIPKNFGVTPVEIKCDNDKCKPSKWVAVLSLHGQAKGKKTDLNRGAILVGKNYKIDIEAYREHYCKNTKWYLSDLDYQGKTVPTPSGMSDVEFMQKIVNAYETFKKNIESNPPKYGLCSTNCAAWVNGLLKSVGISREDRVRLGEFWGIDWAEESNVFDKYFENL